MLYVNPENIESIGYTFDDSFPEKPPRELCERTVFLLENMGPDASAPDAVATWEELARFLRENDELYPNAYEYILENGFFWAHPLRRI